MIGALVSAGAGIAGNMIANNQANKRQAAYNRWIDKQITDSKLTYEKERNKSYLDTAEGRGMMTSLRKGLRKNFEKVDNTAVKTGGSAEQTVAKKEAAGESFSEGVARIAGQGTARKDSLRREHLAQTNHLNGIKGSVMQGEINAAHNSAANALNNGFGAAASFINSGEGEGVNKWLSGLFKGNKAGIK